MTQWVYSFGAGHNEGRADMRNLLGGKGANLAEMASIGLPVPPGFTLTTEVCTAFYANDHAYPAELKAQVREALHRIEAAVGLKFGDKHKPLLVSVRSGARVSMPGIETRAPERTETRRGLCLSPNLRPTAASIRCSASRTWAFSSAG